VVHEYERHFSNDFSPIFSSRLERKNRRAAGPERQNDRRSTAASLGRRPPRCGSVRSIRRILVHVTYTQRVRRAQKSNVDWNAIRGRAAIYTPKAPKQKKKSWQKTQAPPARSRREKINRKNSEHTQHTEAAALGTLWPDSMGNLPTCASELFLLAIRGRKMRCISLSLYIFRSLGNGRRNYSLCLRIRAQNRKPTKTERQTKRNLERGVTSKWARDGKFPERGRESQRKPWVRSEFSARVPLGGFPRSVCVNEICIGSIYRCPGHKFSPICEKP